MRYILKLYINNHTSASNEAIDNLKKILSTDKSIKGKYKLEIIDISKNPSIAEKEKIMVIPTLVKKLPEPIRRIVGDLSDKEKVLVGLDLVEIQNLKKVKTKK